MLLSVVIPSYNSVSWLRRAVESAHRFAPGRVEVIVVDDGSTDETPELCRLLAAEFADLVVLRQPNGGLSSARNLGAQRATGSHLLFLDADDELIPQPAVIGMPPDADMLQFGMEEVSIENQVKWHHLDPLEPQTGAQYLNRCFLGGHFFAPSVVYIYRLDWYRASRLCFRNGLLHEDMLFTVQALLACGRLQRWPVPVYRYFRRPGSITSTESAEHQQRRVASLAAIAKELTTLAPSHRAVDLGWWTLFVMDYAGRIAARGGGWRARWLTVVMELRFIAFNRVWAPFRTRQSIRYRTRQRLESLLSKRS